MIPIDPASAGVRDGAGSNNIGDEYAELSGSAHDKALRICNKRTEVCHCTNAYKDKAGIDSQLNA